MILRSKLLAIGLLGLLVLLDPSVLSASGTTICDTIAGNLVKNCGFEGGVFSSTTDGHTNPNVPVDWTSSAGFDFNSSFNQRSTNNPNNGTYDLSIGNFDNPPNTNPLATLSQTFTDTLGTMYTVTFYALTSGSGDPNAYLTVSANGGSMSLSDSASTLETWAPYTFSFTGTGSDTLTIAAQTDPGEWFVDDITVLGPSTAPEPASFFLMGSGLLAMGGILRRRFLRI